MGKFSEQFKLQQRIKQADWSKEETLQHWKNWAVGVVQKSEQFTVNEQGEKSNKKENRDE